MENREPDPATIPKTYVDVSRRCHMALLILQENGYYLQVLHIFCFFSFIRENKVNDPVVRGTIDSVMSSFPPYLCACAIYSIYWTMVWSSLMLLIASSIPSAAVDDQRFLCAVLRLVERMLHKSDKRYAQHFGDSSGTMSSWEISAHIVQRYPRGTHRGTVMFLVRRSHKIIDSQYTFVCVFNKYEYST